ncbi:MAG: extracellular solute-binding protein, partial [Spirochaetales bacterium]
GCSSEKKDTLYLFNWTYYTPESVIELFEEEFNVNVRIDNYASNEEMYTKIKAGATGYDIVFPSQDYVTIMLKQDMFEKLDLTQLPNTANINPAVLEKATYDPTMQYSVPYGMTVAGIAVNNEKVTDYEKSWNIFEREDLKNRMSMLDDMREVMGAALIYLGYSTDTVDDGELAEAEELLKTKWTPNLVKFDAEGFGKSFASGDFWVSHGYAEVVFGEVPEEKWHTIDYFIPEEGAPLYIDSMCILKGSKNYDLALQFIDFIHRPEIYALFLDEFQFPPVINTEAAQFVTTTPMYEIDDISGYEIPGDLAENISKYNNIWERIRFAN